MKITRDLLDNQIMTAAQQRGLDGRRSPKLGTYRLFGGKRHGAVPRKRVASRIAGIDKLLQE
jgi:hypothetical protein